MISTGPLPSGNYSMTGAWEVEFYKNTLQGFQKGNVIFDIGADRGDRTDIVRRLGAKGVAVDPDAANQEALRQRFLKHRFTFRLSLSSRCFCFLEYAPFLTSHTLPTPVSTTIHFT